MNIALTGHRDTAIIGESNSRLRRRLRERAHAALKSFKDVHGDDTKLLTGLALGIDQDVTLIALDLGITCWAFIPGTQANQSHFWTFTQKEVYDGIIKLITQQDGGHITYVQEQTLVQNPLKPGTSIFCRRNAVMVDNAHHLLSFYHPNMQTSGTAQACRYAMRLWYPGHELADMEHAQHRITWINPKTVALELSKEQPDMPIKIASP